jgi:hypothetical protein
MHRSGTRTHGSHVRLKRPFTGLSTLVALVTRGARATAAPTPDAPPAPDATPPPTPDDAAVPAPAQLLPEPPAGPDAALIHQGEDLARAGDFSHAIALFKQADHLRATAATSCRIGLAYTRRELWPQAEFFFSLCQSRATATEPVPTWLPAAQRQLTEKLAAVDAALIDLRVEPAGAAARLTISSFLPDEQFPPQPIHLTPGQHVLTAQAPGYASAHLTLTITRNVPQIVSLSLAPLPPPPTRGERLRAVLWPVAAGLAVTGVAFHLLARDERATLQAAHDAHDPVAWDRHAGTFATYRDLTVASYVLATSALLAGYLLGRDHDEAAPRLSAAAQPHGALLVLTGHL